MRLLLRVSSLKGQSSHPNSETAPRSTSKVPIPMRSSTFFTARAFRPMSCALAEAVWFQVLMIEEESLSPAF